jgi:hypothetical protein
MRTKVDLRDVPPVRGQVHVEGGLRRQVGVSFGHHVRQIRASQLFLAVHEKNDVRRQVGDPAG